MSDLMSTNPVVVPGSVGCKVMLDLSPRAIAERAELHDFAPWQLRTPLTKYALCGIPHGLDNGCFSGRLPDAQARTRRVYWMRLLAEILRDVR